MSSRMLRVVVAVLGVVVLLAGAAAGVGALLTDQPGSDEVPASPQALAWVATQHLPAPAAARARSVDEGLFVELAYDPPGRRGGSAVSVSVVPQRTVLDCEALVEEPAFDGCEKRGDVTVFWQEGGPKGPGVLYVEAVNDGTSVVVFQQGARVPADIDDYRGEVSLDDMIAAATDPRLGLTTTQEAVDEGARLDWWRG